LLSKTAIIKQKPNDAKNANLSANTPGAGVPIFRKGKIDPQNSKAAKKTILLFFL
jgi:hypothetical protein